MNQPCLPEEESPVLSASDILHFNHHFAWAFWSFPSQLCGVCYHPSTSSFPPKTFWNFPTIRSFSLVPPPTHPTHICGFTSFYFSTIIFIKSPEAEKKNTQEQNAVIKKQNFENYADVTASQRSLGRGEGGGDQSSHIPAKSPSLLGYGHVTLLGACLPNVVIVLVFVKSISFLFHLANFFGSISSHVLTDSLKKPFF